MPRLAGGTVPRLKHPIVYLIGQLGSGGSERQLYYLVSKLAGDAYRPAVVVWNFAESEPYVKRVRESGAEVYGLDRKSRPARLHALRAWVRAWGAEVVHSYSFYTNILAYLSVANSGAVSVGSLRSDVGAEVRRSGFVRAALNLSRPYHLVCNSQATAEATCKLPVAVRPRAIHVVANGIDVAAFNPSAAADWHEPHIVGIGSLLHVKRWDRLIEAASVLRSRGAHFRMSIAGDGPLKERLQGEIARRDLRDRVRMLGYVDDIPRLLARSNFVVHTADDEGSPNAILEAMAAARAVIAIDVPGCRELVRDGESGFLVRRGDEAGLIDRIVTLIENQQLCVLMGVAGRRRVEADFTLERLFESTLGVYRRAGWAQCSGWESPGA